MFVLNLPSFLLTLNLALMLAPCKQTVKCCVASHHKAFRKSTLKTSEGLFTFVGEKTQKQFLTQWMLHIKSNA